MTVQKTERTSQATAEEAEKTIIEYKDAAHGPVEIEADLCKGCLLCIESCPPGVLLVSKNLNKMGYHPAEYVGEKCTSCGICFYICPEPGTIRVYKARRAKERRARREER